MFIHHQHFSQVGSLTVPWLGLLVLCGLIELAVGFLKQLSYIIALSVPFSAYRPQCQIQSYYYFT